VRAKVAALSLVGAFFASSAAAHHVTVSDPNDARGRFDIKTARVLEGSPRRAKTTMYKRWTAKRVWDRGYVLVYLDTLADERFDYHVLIRSTGREMKAKLYRDRKDKNDYVVTWVDAWKPDKRSVSVKLPLRKTKWGKSRTFYRWSVVSIMSGPRCKRVCFDRAPATKAVEEPRPGTPPPEA
jgi:hypothetical protein